MNYLTLEQLQKLPTPRLLAYKTKLMKVSHYICDCGSSDCVELLYTDYGPQNTKSSPEWRKAYTDVKNVLKTREHIPNEKHI